MTNAICFSATMHWLSFFGGYQGYALSAVLGIVIAFLSIYIVSLRRQKNLLIRTTSVDYSIPDEKKEFGPLLVTYCDKQYTKLAYCEIEIMNLTKNAIIQAPVILSLGENSSVIASYVKCSEGVENPPPPTQAGLSPGNYRYIFDGLHPRDSVVLKLLVAKMDKCVALYRGDPKIRIVMSEEEFKEPMMLNIRNALLLYLVSDALKQVELIGPIAAALLSFLYVPLIMNIIAAWKSATFRDLKKAFTQSQSMRDISIEGENNSLMISQGIAPASPAKVEET